MNVFKRYFIMRSGMFVLLSLSLSFGGDALSQGPGPAVATTETASEAPKDTLGRDTPRGTVIRFLTAARKGNYEVASLYLNTDLRGQPAETLARELAMVLDSRLPARLNNISDMPEGSLPDPLRPDEDLVGTITTTKGDLPIMVERVDRGKFGKVWVFSSTSLASIPEVYKELNESPLERYLPKFLLSHRLATIPLFQWLAVFVGLPFLYFLTGIANWLLCLGVVRLIRQLGGNFDRKATTLLPRPIRLLLIAVFIRWLLSWIPLPLLARQFWSIFSLIILIIGCMWMMLLLTGSGERYLLGRVRSLNGSAAVLRLVRRLIDVIVLFAGLLIALHYFGIKITGALAGLGVGGIAVALAAQKTLENVIAGVSLIADKAVRVGDFINLGDLVGTVQDIGLRSTRIRTLDRTLVSVPNGQLANIRLETISARDRFWFHPTIVLHHETTTTQLRSILTSVQHLLEEHSSIESDSVRVRFVRFGACSLDIEIVSYVFAPDWNGFLEVQEDLLLSIRDIVQRAGTSIAFPFQTVYLANDAAVDRAPRPVAISKHARSI